MADDVSLEMQLDIVAEVAATAAARSGAAPSLVGSIVGQAVREHRNHYGSAFGVVPSEKVQDHQQVLQPVSILKEVQVYLGVQQDSWRPSLAAPLAAGSSNSDSDTGQQGHILYPPRPKQCGHNTDTHVYMHDTRPEAMRMKRSAPTCMAARVGVGL